MAGMAPMADSLHYAAAAAESMPGVESMQGLESMHGGDSMDAFLAEAPTELADYQYDGNLDDAFLLPSP